MIKWLGVGMDASGEEFCFWAVAKL